MNACMDGAEVEVGAMWKGRFRSSFVYFQGLAGKEVAAEGGDS